jgi:hypothetical protein
VKHINLQSRKIGLTYEIDPSNTTYPVNDGFVKCPRLLLYHRAEAFDVRLFASRYMHLDRNRSLELELSTGWNNVISGELQVRAGTAGLRLQTSDVEVISGNLDINKRSDAGVISFGEFAAESSAKLRMSFNLEHEVNDVSLRLEITYTTADGTFSYATNSSLSTLLPLGVNVQDVFKQKALFSKFTVSSSTSSPLRLLSCNLEGSEAFKAQCGGDLNGIVTVYPRQPASLLYKITRNASSSKSGGVKKGQTALSLVLHYICLEEEIDCAVDQALGEALKETPFYQYRRLIVPTILSQLASRISYIDSEHTALLNEISTSVLAGVNWRDSFNGLGRETPTSPDRGLLVSQWVQKWLAATPVIPLLPITPAHITESRSIIIPVEIPSISVVFTADIHLEAPTSPDGRFDFAALNESIPASLRIKWTRLWDTSPSDEDENPDTLNFVYDITAPTETWLLGGRRKAHFSIPVGQDSSADHLSFPLILIPLKEGYLTYPSVDIKPAPITKLDAEGRPQSRGAERRVTCEVDVANAGEVVRCIGDMGRVSVSLDPVGNGGGAWVVESERRAVNV